MIFTPPPSGFFWITQTRVEIFQRNFSYSLSITKNVWPSKNFLNTSFFWEGRILNEDQILALFHFFLKIGLACRKIEASKDFGTRVGADMLFRNSPPPELHNNRCSCYCPFSLNFPAVLPSEIRASLEKIYIFGILVNPILPGGGAKCAPLLFFLHHPKTARGIKLKLSDLKDIPLRHFFQVKPVCYILSCCHGNKITKGTWQNLAQRKVKNQSFVKILS